MNHILRKAGTPKPATKPFTPVPIPEFKPSWDKTEVALFTHKNKATYASQEQQRHNLSFKMWQFAV